MLRNINKAIIFAQRPAVKSIVREELNKLGLKSVTSASDESDCRRQLGMFPGALFVFDWEWGGKIAGKVLQAASTNIYQEPRPIYILAMQSNLEIVAIGLEYRAARIHLGEPTAASVGEHLRDIMDMHSGKKDIDAAFQEVYAARAVNDWNKAEKAIRQIMVYHPENERAIIELAVNQIATKQWEKALATIQELATEDDLNLRAKGLYARCLMALKRDREAVVVLEQAHIVHPNHVERLIDLGRGLLRIDRVKDAYERFHEAFQVNNESKEALFGMSSCKLMQGDINASLDLLRNASTPEETASVFNTAAIVSIRNGRFEHGFKLYNAALVALGDAKKPVIARILFNMGLAYYHQNDLTKAQEFFTRATALDADFKKAAHNITVLEKLKSLPEKDRKSPEFAEVQLMQDFEDEKF